MLLALFLLGTWPFWLLIGIFIMIEIGLLSHGWDDEPLPGIFGLMAFAFLVLGTDALQGVSWAQAGMIALAYALVGVVWSFKKWWTYVTEQKQKLKSSFKSGGYEYVNGTRYEDLPAYLAACKPTPVMSRVANWMMLWPFSMGYWVLEWPRRFFSWAAKKLGTVYGRITDYIWSKA